MFFSLGSCSSGQWPVCQPRNLESQIHEIWTDKKLKEEVDKKLRDLISSFSASSATYQLRLTMAASELYRISPDVEATLAAFLPESPLLIAELTGQRTKEFLVLRQCEVTLEQKQAIPFGVRLMRPEHRKKCWTYLQLAKDAYEEQGWGWGIDE